MSLNHSLFSSSPQGFPCPILLLSGSPYCYLWEVSCWEKLPCHASLFKNSQIKLVCHAFPATVSSLISSEIPTFNGALNLYFFTLKHSHTLCHQRLSCTPCEVQTSPRFPWQTCCTASGCDPNPCYHLSPSSQNLGIIPGISLSYAHLDSAGLKGDGSVGNWSHIAVDFTAYFSNVFFYIHQALVNSLLSCPFATSCCHSSSVIKLLSWNHLVALQNLQEKCEQGSFEQTFSVWSSTHFPNFG